MAKCKECEWLGCVDTVLVKNGKQVGYREGGMPQKLDEPIYYCNFRAYMGEDPYRKYLEEKGEVYTNSLAKIGSKLPASVPEFCPKKRFGIK